MSAAHHFACPHCGVKIKAPPAAFGKSLKCPKCRQPLTIPNPYFLPQAAPPVAAPPVAAPPPIETFQQAPPPIRRQPDARDEELEELRQELSELRQEHRRAQREYEPPVYAPQPVTLVEQTSKSWKAIQLIGGLVGSFTLFLICTGIADNPNHNKNAVATLVFISLAAWLLYLYGKIGAWWHHG